jgi:hypothetical protein
MNFLMNYFPYKKKEKANQTVLKKAVLLKNIEREFLFFLSRCTIF